MRHAPDLDTGRWKQMRFSYEMPVKVYFGKRCLNKCRHHLCSLGSRFLLVTGRSSGRLSGALDDAVSVLNENRLEYEVFDGVVNNPTLENVAEGAITARRFHADAVLGIGGGSPLDAAKAIAVLAVNDIEPHELYTNKFETVPLPVAAIPTTSGTGSEVTPYSILTRNDIKTKKSFGCSDMFPKAAFLDPSYTYSLPYNVTVDTAADAFSHAAEGYLSKRSTCLSDIYAVECMAAFGRCLPLLLKNNIKEQQRDELMYMAMLGGMVITHTGTTIVHGLGYQLTYNRDIPHGRANAVFMEQYLRYNSKVCGEKVDNILKLTGTRTFDEFGSAFGRLGNVSIDLSPEEIDLYAEMAYQKKSTSFNPRVVEKEDLKKIIKEALGR